MRVRRTEDFHRFSVSHLAGFSFPLFRTVFGKFLIQFHVDVFIVCRGKEQMYLRNKFSLLFDLCMCVHCVCACAVNVWVKCCFSKRRPGGITSERPDMVFVLRHRGFQTHYLDHTALFEYTGDVWNTC